MELLTPRLSLRPFEKSDITTTYLGWLNDSFVTRFSNQRFRRHTKESSEAYLSGFAETSNSFLLIKKRSDNKSIGTATVYQNINHSTADIGLMLGDRSCWGKGYGGEAWLGIITNLLSINSIRKVTGGTVRTNYAMVRIMEKSGMELEAVHARQELIEGQPVDLLYYALFAESAP